MKIYIASDHAAVSLKSDIISRFASDYEMIDLGPDSEDSVHYPDFAISLCQSLAQEPNARGILLCGSGIGMSMVANRFRGIRAALCKSEEEARLSRQHNNANVLCLGARVSSPELIMKMIEAWMTTDFEGGRHLERVQKFNDLGEKIFKHQL